VSEIETPTENPLDTAAAEITEMQRQLAEAQLCIKHLYKCCDSADVYNSMLDAMPSEKAKTLMDRIKEIK